MKILTTLLLGTLFLSTHLWGQAKKTNFNIVGQVEGFSDGTKIYLNDLSGGNYVKIDSALVAHGKFTFRGQLKTTFLISSITTADYADRATLWLEKGTTTFTAQKGNFKKANIKGFNIQDKFAELNKLRDTLEQTAHIDYAFIQQNPNSVISAYTLGSYCGIWGKDTLSTLYKAFSKDVQQTRYGKKIFAFLSLNRNLKVGDQFVDFAQKDTSGQLVKLSGIKANALLLEFWGSWCGPCREENPFLVEIYNEFKPKGFEIVGIAAESNHQQWTKAIKADKLNWINVTDLKGSDNQAAIIYGVSGYPSNFLIDQNGIIIAKDVYGEALRNWLLKIL
jgi:thiol-disulfide isomerase/thioredoxin